MFFVFTPTEFTVTELCDDNDWSLSDWHEYIAFRCIRDHPESMYALRGGGGICQKRTSAYRGGGGRVLLKGYACFPISGMKSLPLPLET